MRQAQRSGPRKAHRGTAARHVFCLLCCVAAASAAGAAHAATRVTFAHPQRYTDANLNGGYGDKAREFALQGIASHLRRLGDRYLAPNQTLNITVLDVDLAGEFEPWRVSGYNTRFMREGTWPRIRMRYRLDASGRTLKQGEETVAGLDYLMNAVGRSSSDPLRYEKAMLDDWFRARFGTRSQ
jgi:hypothetical protein